MDQQREVGIVLRHYGRHITIFDHKHRRHDVVVYRAAIPRGSFVSYLIIKQKGVIVATDVRLEYMPLAQAKTDIYFLHALLDVCYHFIPEGGVEVPVYAFLVTVLRSFEQLTSERLQKNIVCALFARLGVYPPDSQLYGLVEQLSGMPIDKVVEGNLELTDEDFLNKWLIWCVQMYPQGMKCKSLPLFLQKR